jgi:hypothetical protein
MSSNQNPSDEIVPLNADQLDAEKIDEIDEEGLEDVAGGSCNNNTCGINL